MITDDRDRTAALADRSRRRVFDAVTAAPAPIGVAELADTCGIHPNTVRLHLQRLLRAGLVMRATDVHRRPGRPAHRYIAAADDPALDGSAYRRLAGTLARALKEGATAREAGRAMAMRRGRPETAGVGGVVAALAHEGFRPVVDATAGQTEVVMQTCPFADLAAEDPATICQLHFGFAEGTAARVGGVSVERLIVKDPFQAACRLVLRRQDANETST